MPVFLMHPLFTYHACPLFTYHACSVMVNCGSRDPAIKEGFFEIIVTFVCQLAAGKFFVLLFSNYVPALCSCCYVLPRALV